MAAADPLSCFKAYDIRGKLGEELNDEIAYRIGFAYATHLQAKKVAVGGDIRESSYSLKLALAKGLIAAGADVIDIGMVGTEEIYFASFYLDVDGGIEVTASHNPIDFNGMKLVGRDALPISGDSGLPAIKELAINTQVQPDKLADVDILNSIHYTKQSILEPYIEHLLGYVNLNQLKPMRLVVNAGNGAAGHVIDAIETRFRHNNVPIEFIKINHQADGSFPNGIPNPLLPENRGVTVNAVIENHADFGIAWDGDFDRCFLFDENGRFIEGYYIVGLLAEAFLRKNPNEKVVHDPRLTWNTISQVRDAGGTPVMSKTGHAFIKERMRAENAIYGGEMSAHHYFRDFSYCDSGMLPWLIVVELLSTTQQKLSSLVAKRMAAFPCSGEINFSVNDAKCAIEHIQQHYSSQIEREKHKAVYPLTDFTDGLSMEFADWRFNIRASNTEALLRLNVESRSNKALVTSKVREISDLLNNH